MYAYYMCHIYYQCIKYEKKFKIKFQISFPSNLGGTFFFEFTKYMKKFIGSRYIGYWVK